jgi:thioredoxin-like negative regulator of GroEL
MPTPKTPFGVSVETPLPTSSPATSPRELEPETEPEAPLPAVTRVPAEDDQILDPIRLRYKGYTYRDIAKLQQEARELEDDGNLADTKEKYRELLDISKNLLSVGSETYKDVVYEAAWFFARNEDMEQADQILDNLSEETTRRWGPAHEQTIRHYAKVGVFLAQWNRHDDAVGIIARITDNEELHARTSWTPSTLEKPQENIRFNSAPNGNNNESSATSVLELLNILEQSPYENATDIVRMRCLLVTTYEKLGMQGKANETLSLAKDRTLELCKQRLELTTTFFQSAIDLARALLKAKQPTTAEDLLDRLQEKFMDDYGNDHPDTISLLIEAGKMFQQLKRWDLARPRFEAAYAGAMSQFGIDSLLVKRLETSLENKRFSMKAS